MFWSWGLQGRPHGMIAKGEEKKKEAALRDQKSRARSK